MAVAAAAPAAMGMTASMATTATTRRPAVLIFTSWLPRCYLLPRGSPRGPTRLSCCMRLVVLDGTSQNMAVWSSRPPLPLSLWWKGCALGSDNKRALRVLRAVGSTGITLVAALAVCRKQPLWVVAVAVAAAVAAESGRGDSSRRRLRGQRRSSRRRGRRGDCSSRTTFIGAAPSASWFGLRGGNSSSKVSLCCWKCCGAG